jgi:hypothetical protein
MDALERRTMLLLYRKAMRLVGMGQDFLKNKKLFAVRARDNHAPVGPTPLPLQLFAAQHFAATQHFALTFRLGVLGYCAWIYSAGARCAGTSTRPARPRNIISIRNIA